MKGDPTPSVSQDYGGLHGVLTYRKLCRQARYILQFALANLLRGRENELPGTAFVIAQL